MTRISQREVHILERIKELALTLCAIAALSAIAEVLLTGKKGGQTVCLMLSLAGISAILMSAAALLGKTN